MKKACVLLVLVACGGGSSATPDAAPDSAATADASPDGADGCSGAQMVTVEGPAFPPDNTQAVMLTVVSHDATGAMCNQATGSGSEAQLAIATPPGGMVTAVLDVDGNRSLLTWTAVSPGEDLLFPSPVTRGATVQVVHVSLDIPVFTGAASYDVELLCEGGGGSSTSGVPTGAFTKDLQCLGSATKVTAAIRARGASTSSFSVGDLAPITSGAATITLGTYAPAQQTRAIVHGASGFVGATLGVAPTPSAQYAATLFGATGGAAEPMTVGPIDVPATWAAKSSVYLSTQGTPAHSLFWAKYYATAPATIDLTTSTDMLPRVDGSVTGSWPRPTVTWSFQSTAPDADIAFARVDTWSIMGPGHPGTLRFPELPADLVPTGAVELKAIDVVDGATEAGYAQAHLDPMQLLIDTDSRITSFGQPFAAILL